MTNGDAKKQLYDTTFAIGTFRRRAAIKALLESPDPASVLTLAEALVKGHPDSAKIEAMLLQLSAERDAEKVKALWLDWARSPTESVAAVLARLGWPTSRAVDAPTARLVLGAASAHPSLAATRQAVSAFTPMLKELVMMPDEQGMLALAQILGKGHPNAEQLSEALLQLSAERDAEKVKALWLDWARSPTESVAAVLARLGWPTSQSVDGQVTRDILGLMNPGVEAGILGTVVAFARALPLGDEAANDAIYATWVRAQSPELEELIADQGRQCGSPALETLYSLVTSRFERYAALKDDDTMLFVQAFAMAPEPFRARLAPAVAASPDRRLKEAYRRAMSSAGVDAASQLDNLKLVGDEDGLFETLRSLRLAEGLELCERWAGIAARPSGAQQRAAVERAVTAWRSLGDFKVEPGPKLPDGLVDIFDWWRSQKPSDAKLRADLDAPDPFRKARGLYLGHGRGLVDSARIAAAGNSEHWPERLVARLVDPVLAAQVKEDHVLWVSTCAGDAALLNALLNAEIGGTPEDYARHTGLLAIAHGTAATPIGGLLEILCGFQAVFVAGEITVDDSAEATYRRAVEI